MCVFLLSVLSMTIFFYYEIGAARCSRDRAKRRRRVTVSVEKKKRVVRSLIQPHRNKNEIVVVNTPLATRNLLVLFLLMFPENRRGTVPDVSIR